MIAATLAGHGEPRRVARDEFLYREGDVATTLCLVEEGVLDVSVAATGGERGTTVLGSVGVGAVIGEIGALLGGVRTADVRAREHAAVRVIDRATLDRAMGQHAELARALEAVVRERLQHNRAVAVIRTFLGDVPHKVVSAVLGECEQVSVERGTFLFRAGEGGDSLYLLVSGVLEVVHEGDGIAIARIYRGEPVGEMALVSDETRSASVRAVRSCELLRLSRDDFERMVPVYPEILMGVTRTLVTRMRSRQQLVARAQRGNHIAVIPAGGVRGALNGTNETVRSIVTALYDAMPSGVSGYVLTSELISQSFGSAGTAQEPSDSPRGYALRAWMEALEALYDVLFLVADESELSGWTKRCLAQADSLLVIADEGVEEAPSGLEAAVYAMEEVTSTASVDLMIVHPPGRTLPRDTARILRQRPVRHHFHAESGRCEDTERIARCLTGRAVGLALGGGGARGVAHAGVLRALTEAAVPVDCVSGTSMGAVVGALQAMRHTHGAILSRVEEMFVRRKPFREFTWPRYALLRGLRTQRAAAETFGTYTIEDLWIPFVCTSANLSTQTLAVHRVGSLARAILSSTAVPGVTVPQPIDGDVHVDGGVLNNLPGDLLPAYCARRMVCDVTPAPELRYDGAVFPPPISAPALLKRNGPESTAPSIGTILYASMTAGSQAHARAVRERADVVIQPPVAQYGLLAFEQFRTIEEHGHRAAHAVLDGLPAAWWQDQPL